MRFSNSVLTGLVPLISLASAGITGFSVPKQLGAGSTFTATVITENYIQSITDVSIVFGIATSEYADSGTLGTQLLKQKTLGTELSNILTNITVEIALPADFEKGEAVLAASLFSLGGSRYSPYINIFNATVSVADKTDASQTVSSNGFISIYQGA